MAIIKCPECGRQISDKAPVCPNCGVEIAGKITKCPQCGEVYFNNQEVCPNCHHLTYVSESAGHDTSAVSTQGNRPSQPRESQSVVAPPIPPISPNTPAEQPNKSSKRKPLAFILALLMALFICGICFYFYNSAKENKEQEAYEFAMKSNDPLVLQTYLDNNIDAPEEHRDSVTMRLENLKKQDNDWDNAIVSGSKTALLDYIANHPDSEHLTEAKHKIDSIDWADASTENTVDAMELYLAQHASGEHVDEATTAIKQMKAKTVQSDEKSQVVSTLRHFFQSINSKDEAGLESSVAPILTNFLGKTDATRADVLTFMNKIYKEDITNMNWHLNNDYKINKKEVGDERYEYSVNFSSLQKIERGGAENSQEIRYQISATINPDGLISAMSMTKILE
ncbi:MAG: zinc ribbon domain-containing protein [Prevotella sp.]|nr:zinc ribbon domain-containing protein [Prevotella sp.]